MHYLVESGSPWHAKRREGQASRATILTMKPLKAENKEMLQPKTTPLSKGMMKRKLKVNEQLPLRTLVSKLKQAFACCQSTVANPVDRLPLGEANAL